MAAGHYNFTLEQGATLKKQFTYKDSAGNPVNLNSYSARMQIRSSIGSNTTIADLDTSTKGGLSMPLQALQFLEQLNYIYMQIHHHYIHLIKQYMI